MTTERATRIREAGDRARELLALQDHPGWETLRSELDKLRALEQQRLARELLRGGAKAPPLDQRRVDFQRGFFAGAEWVIKNPQMAEASLRKAMEEHV